jgi:hypothetical protein
MDYSYDFKEAYVEKEHESKIEIKIDKSIGEIFFECKRNKVLINAHLFE